MMVTSVRLTPREHRLLKEIAYRERRSLSDQIRYLIEEAAEPADHVAAEEAA